MLNENHKYYKALNIAIEVTAVWIVLYAYHLIYDQEPITVKLLIWLTVSLVLFLIIKSIQHRLKLLHFITLTPILVLVGWLIGLSVISATFFSGFIIWRMIRHDEVPELETESRYIGLSIVAAFIGHMAGVYQDSEYANGILVLLICQFSILFIGKLIFSVISDENLNLKKIYTIVFLLLILFGSTSLLFITYPIIRMIYNSIINGFISVFAFILQPLFNYLEAYEPKLDEDENEEQEQGQGKNNIEESYFDMTGEPLITSEHLVIGFFVIVTIIILLIMYKKRHTLMQSIKLSKKNDKEFITESSRTNEMKLWRFKRNKNLPNSEVRKAFYKLEEWAAKRGYGRYKDESIKEYLERHELQHLVDDEVIQIYKDVRYGNMVIPTSQKNLYLEQLNQLKEHLKQKIKNEQEAEEENSDQKDK